MRTAALFLITILAMNVAAIDIIQDNRPSTVPADAKPTLQSDLSEAPPAQQTLTNITIERMIPDKVASGDTFTVTLRVTNFYTTDLNILVVDPQRQGVTYIGGPEPFIAQYEGLAVPLFRWMEKLSPGQTKEYSYQVKAAGPGTITFPPATVNDDFGNTFETPAAFVKVDCKPSGRCDSGKNYINCPQDCPTGSKDDVCDAAVDGRIDPDCAVGADPDSAKGTTTTLPQVIPGARKETASPACNLFAMPVYSLLLAAFARRII